MTRVDLCEVGYTYPGGATAAVRDVSVTAAPGELVALLGPSGCGKTTVLKLIAGLLHPSRGRIRFDGLDVTGVRAERREAVMVFQNHLLFPFMTVWENIAFGLRMRRCPAGEIARCVGEMLERMRLKGLESRKPAQLSGGQRQRVALARALVLKPLVLLLDEPFSNLDAHLRDEMRELILSLKQSLDVTIMFVTHDQEEAVLLADRIALMFHGEVQQFGEASLFFEKPATREIAEFFGNRNFIAGIKRGRRVTTAVGDFSITSEDQPDGPVWLTVRPESVLLERRTGNSVSGTVLRRIYMGTHVRYRVRIADSEWDLLGTAHRDHPAEPRVDIYLPPERICLISRNKPGD